MLVRSQRLLQHGFRHGFSTRTGGVSRPPFDSLNLARNVGDEPTDVAENHARLGREVGYDTGRLAEASQVHGARCLDVDPFVSEGRLDLDGVRAEQADALMAGVRGLAVGVRTADCVPILLADRRSRAVLAVHAGWRGAVAGVVPRALAALVARHGGTPATFLAAIGPHIRRASFEVGDDVASELERTMPRGPEAEVAERIAGELVSRAPEARPRASLATLVIAQLLAAGMGVEDVEDVGGDTCADAPRFHSHRRDAARSGRMLSVIVAG